MSLPIANDQTQPRKRPPVRLEVPDRRALIALAEALGEVMADKWLAGELEIDVD